MKQKESVTPCSFYKKPWHGHTVQVIFLSLYFLYNTWGQVLTSTFFFLTLKSLVVYKTHIYFCDFLFFRISLLCRVHALNSEKNLKCGFRSTFLSFLNDELFIKMYLGVHCVEQLIWFIPGLCKHAFKNTRISVYIWMNCDYRDFLVTYKISSKAQGNRVLWNVYEWGREQAVWSPLTPC